MLNASNIFTLLKSAEQILKSNDIPEPETDAEVLLADVLNVKRGQLPLIRTNPVSPDSFNKYKNYISKRITRQPVAYILGKTEFMGLDFIVTEDVLIPRQETEILVEEVLNRIKINKYSEILDMCTGSGCIAVSAAKYANVYVTASDISLKAADVARKNAEINNVSDRINFIAGDMFFNIPAKKFDIIVSNPPYIAEKEFNKLEKELSFEPRNALVADEDGLFFYRRIAQNSKKYLNQNGLIIVELNATIAELITEIFSAAGYKTIKILNDYAGLKRVLVTKNG
jgi:release factor glutamine methyltransferase